METSSLQNAENLIALLENEYGTIKTELNYKNIFELLIAVVLSAQTTDKQVNIVTQKLFSKYPDAPSLATAQIADVENCLRSLGLYRRKSKAIIECARQIIDEHGGLVPCSRPQLMGLSGVGRKCANVILAIGCNEAALPVDTHVFRLAHRLGLTEGKTPLDVEKDLMVLVPESLWNKFHLLLIHHGRLICKAKKPNCLECVLSRLCPSYEPN